MKYLHTYSTLATTGLGALLVTGLTACDTKNTQEQQTQHAFVIIEETTPGKYQIKDEFPAEETRIVLKSLDGTEKVLTKEELDTLMQQENAKIDSGNSGLTQASASNGFSLGEAVLASMAGALIGSWIGSKLFNNQNFQNNRKAGYKSPSTYSRSKSSFNKAKQSRAKKNSRSGFFNKKQGSTGRSGFFGG